MRWNDFYPRPPRGGRPHRTCRATTAVLFLSTPSARRATGFCKVLYWSKEFLSTPSARRATQLHPHPDNPRKISIHALREEGDGSGQFVLDCVYLFLSTPSARRATIAVQHILERDAISIHALREEGDGGPRRPERVHQDFYPRPPRGGRPSAGPGRAERSKFLSTPSARRATVSSMLLSSLSRFLSTPSARRATPALLYRGQARQHFYPRPPRGGRRRSNPRGEETLNFYPRPPRGGRRAVLRDGDTHK